MSKCIVIAGGTGAGKTTYVKGLLKKHKGKQLIYDVNNEYGREYVSMERFYELALKAEDSLIVFEEATIFFDTSGGKVEMRELLVRKRHTNNLFIFNFHSLSQIPLYILMFCDYMVIFKTNDTIAQMERKYKGHDKIWKAFVKIHNSANKHDKERIKLQ